MNLNIIFSKCGNNIEIEKASLNYNNNNTTVDQWLEQQQSKECFMLEVFHVTAELKTRMDRDHFFSISLFFSSSERK